MSHPPDPDHVQDHVQDHVRDQVQDHVCDGFTAFDGSSADDASHARRLWSSVSLLPPQESRLMSADIRQRLPVSRPEERGGGSAAAAAPEPPDRSDPRREERRRYEAMAEQRREILALLRRQREQRIQREFISAAFKPRGKGCRERDPQNPQSPQSPQSPQDSELDEDLVQQLQ